MYIIEYITMPSGRGKPRFHSELALGSTAEEARDQADTHLPVMSSRYGSCGYRIFDNEKRCIAMGPEGFQDS